MKTLLVVFLLALSAAAQDLEDFVYLGHAGENAYGVKLIKRDKNKVEFTGLITPYYPDGSKVGIDPNNYLLTEFEGDCMSFEYSAKRFRGRLGGKSLAGTESPEKAVAEKPQIIYFALEEVCRK